MNLLCPFCFVKRTAKSKKINGVADVISTGFPSTTSLKQISKFVIEVFEHLDCSSKKANIKSK